MNTVVALILHIYCSLDTASAAGVLMHYGLQHALCKGFCRLYKGFCKGLWSPK